MRVKKVYYSNLGVYFFDLFKGDLNSFPKIIEGIINLDPERKIDVPVVYEELTYLYCFVYFQVLNARFKANFNIIEKSFRNELGQYLKKSQSKPSATRIEGQLSRSLRAYRKQYLLTVGKQPGRDGQIKFASYIAERLLDSESSRKASVLMFMMSIYGGIVSNLTKIIDTSIDILK
jgi:hypothetical protein